MNHQLKVGDQITVYTKEQEGMIAYGPRQKMHTGCSCRRCRSGRTKMVRREFHRLLRRTQKAELKRDKDITTANKSIGYTD